MLRILWVVSAVIASASVFAVTPGAPEIVDRYNDQDFDIVQLYSQDELIELINQNAHLKRVRDQDECQLVADIQARAEKVRIPAYEFLYGDMLLYGVCIEPDAIQGMHFIESSALKGFPAGLEQMGRYYDQGKFVQPDKTRALQYLRSAAALGHVRAQMRYAELLLQDYGAPHHLPDAYHWLHNSIIADTQTRNRATRLLTQMADRMPPHVVEFAARPLER